jgi:hypothetical protein
MNLTQPQWKKQLLDKNFFEKNKLPSNLPMKSPQARR